VTGPDDRKASGTGRIVEENPFRERRSSAMHELTRQAFDEAMTRGHGWVGTEHLLLALLAKPSTAGDVLAARGIAYDRLADRLPGGLAAPDAPDPAYDPAAGLSGPNPDGLRVIGRAEGLALASGRPSPDAVDWLLAMIYSYPGMMFPTLLRAFDVTARQLLDDLRGREVPVPAVGPPADDRTRPAS
jgi:ATP-dependent Clp protease ATP-binding subunit ClpA